MIIKPNHLDLISLSAPELRLYLSDIDEKWDFDGWDHPILQGLMLREGENSEIIFTVSNGTVARDVGKLPATQDMFSVPQQSTELKRLFLAKRFGAWVKTELKKSNNDFAKLMNSSKFQENIIPALDKQHKLHKDWVLSHDPSYRQPYEVKMDRDRIMNESFIEKIIRNITSLVLRG
jgi:hypothetical protein